MRFMEYIWIVRLFLVRATIFSRISDCSATGRVRSFRIILFIRLSGETHDLKTTELRNLKLDPFYYAVLILNSS
ncbi:hypothetical protein D3C78_1144000 [compost metagenome]